MKCINCKKHHVKKYVHTCDVCQNKKIFGSMQDQFIKPCHYYEPYDSEAENKPLRFTSAADSCDKCVKYVRKVCTVYPKAGKPKEPATCAWYMVNGGKHE